MNKEEIKDYIKNNLEIQIQLNGDSLCIVLTLENEVISKDFETLPYEYGHYDDIGNRI